MICMKIIALSNKISQTGQDHICKQSMQVYELEDYTPIPDCSLRVLTVGLLMHTRFNLCVSCLALHLFIHMQYMFVTLSITCCHSSSTAFCAARLSHIEHSCLLKPLNFCSSGEKNPMLNNSQK